MFAEERKREILRILNEKGKVRNFNLSQIFSVSEPTIRKDISELDEQKLLIRTHGGALAINANQDEPTFVEKKDKYHKEKDFIGRLAASLIKDHDIVILDSGTTTVEIAKHITAKHITVITNSLNVAQSLENKNDIELIVTGGIMRWNTMAMVGPMTEKALTGIHADIAFVGTNGISEKGFSTPNLIESETKSMMLGKATKKFIVSDSSKIGKTNLSIFASLSDVDGIITDVGIDENFIDYFESMDVDVLMGGGDNNDINGDVKPRD
ncbi:DeoR/GlpR family DNA-binding transcription regulator [Fusibacter ferrireducens]|uniref:DeoR/GlpR transcriptional regulator n=1 Tax=Fusibacter ferrireducens TaxID=2785058 RepID=A0ABR9ZQ41_9FIRM|nr:DeoR/GlpR family DNA-binding transcription regulator [Fusibacter ferrireducens]MBF4692564.1 DeoR/GlpR transcriptional regulator [Fusibacter ferrireducens]